MELSPDWVVGFVDGEGCFYVGIYKHPEMTVGWQVLPELRIVQHKRDSKILYGLKRFFRAGVVRKNHDTRYELRIRKLESLKQIVVFFRKHPLKTSKRVDFEKFAYVVTLMEAEEHLTVSGLQKIVKTAKSMNTAHHPRLEEIEETLKAGRR